MPINPDEMRRVMRQWASGVCLVTTNNGDERHGMTVSSFASIALEPPLILVSLEDGTRTNQLVRQSNRFAVVILSEDQQELSDVFAGRTADDDDRFEGVPHLTTLLGNPVPEASLAFMDCKVSSNYEAGTHTIFIGQVESQQVLNEGKPLLYFNQSYARIDTTE